MSTTRSTKEYEDAFARLPEALRTAVNSVDTLTSIKLVQEENDLHVDQLGELHSIVMDVLYGFLVPEDFVHEIGYVLHIEKSAAEKVAAAADKYIFQKVRASFMQLAGNTSPDPTNRKDLLREIQNPTPTPISGRKYVVQEPAAWPESGGGANDKGRSYADAGDGYRTDVDSIPASSFKLPASPQVPSPSILDERAGTLATPASPPADDPYLERVV